MPQWRIMMNSLIMALGVCIGKIVISIIAAYAVTVIGTLALVAWSWLAMRTAERRREQGRRK